MPAGDPVYADEVESAEEAPIGRCVASGAQALADDTVVAITFTSEEFDSHNQHSTVTNPTRITPNVAGVYEFDGTVHFQAQASPVLTEVFWRISGGAALAPSGAFVGSTTQFTLSTKVYYEMNGTTDYMELCARQNSAGADNTTQVSQYSSAIQWRRVRALIP